MKSRNVSVNVNKQFRSYKFSYIMRRNLEKQEAFSLPACLNFYSVDVSKNKNEK